MRGEGQAGLRLTHFGRHRFARACDQEALQEECTEAKQEARRL